jgi:hypothetical protein
VHPAGPAAAAVAELWWVMLAGATLIFVFVMALLALAFRRGGEGRRPGLWTVGSGSPSRSPCWPRSSPGGSSSASGPRAGGDDGAPRSQAEARQWAWTFRYPGTGRARPKASCMIPAGRPVDVAITSADVIHSFWVPRLAGKLDAIPGHVNVLRLRPTRRATTRASAPSSAARATSARLHRPRARARGLGRLPRGGRAMNALRRHRALTRIWASDPGWRRPFTTREPHRPRTDVPADGGRLLRVGGILAMLIRAQLATPRLGLHGGGNLQPDLHDARHRDDVPLRHPADRGAGDLPPAQDARDPRPRLPAAHRLRLLVLRLRRLDAALLARGGGGARQRLVHVSAAVLDPRLPRASIPISGFWASPSSRSRPSRRRSRSR